MQKLLTGVNRLPSKPEVLRGFFKQSAKIESGVKRCRREVKRYVKDVTRVQKELFRLSGTSVNIKSFPEQGGDSSEHEESTAESIYKTLDSNFQHMLPFVEETVDRWNSRTHTLSKNLGGHKSQSNIHNQKTILQQVSSLLTEEDNRKRLFSKLHTRTDAHKLFGRLHSDTLTQEKVDKQIYNDHDFYQALLKDFLAASTGGGESAQQTNDNNDDDIYVDGADLGMTQKYLERKRKL